MIDASCRVRAALYLSRRHRTASRCRSRQESPVSWTGSPPVEHQLRLVHPSMEIREVPRIRFLQPPHPQPPPPPLSSPVRSALRPRRIRPRHGGTTVVIASPGCQRSAAQLASKADTSGREHLASQLTCALPSRPAHGESASRHWQLAHGSRSHGVMCREAMRSARPRQMRCMCTQPKPASRGADGGR